jgi:hypothetical protein
MADLTFASYLQGPLGEAIEATETMGSLPPPAFAPAVAVTSTLGDTDTAKAPPMRLLGPGDVAALADGTVVRTDPPAGGVDVEPNYLAVAEVVPAELPWLLTPARAADGRLRPWLVLVVLEAAKTPLVSGTPLPAIEAAIAELPDLRDSWGWAHVQRTTGAGTLPGGGQAAAAAVARLVCPRRLSPGVTYRACLVPAFASGRAAGLGDPRAAEVAHDLAWKVGDQGSVKLPVYYQWTFATGPGGDFEELVTRLEPADPEALGVSSVRPVDVRSPWPEDKALAPDAQLVGIQGALVPFDASPEPDPPASTEALAALYLRLSAQLDAPAHRVRKGHAGDTIGALAPPLYGGRHVCQDLVEGHPKWLGQLNTSVANRIAAGLGTNYVRANQEDLMAKAWDQVGAIREANRRRAVVELTTEVAEKIHARHVASLLPGEALALAAPASLRTKTSAETTLAMETRMSRMVDGAATAAFTRRVRPAGKLARRTRVSVRTLIPKALSGEVTVPAGTPVIPESPTVAPETLAEVTASAAATQLLVMTAMARVAAVNDAASGAEALTTRIEALGLGGDVVRSLALGNVAAVASAIAGQVATVTEVTNEVLTDMTTTERAAFGPVSPFGVPIMGTALAERVAAALQPGDSHTNRLATQTELPGHVAAAGAHAPVMACPDFPVPMALALLDSDPEWFMPGLGALPQNKVTLLRQNSAFVESYLVGLNHEMNRELLWREYPTDQRGTPFTRFWPRPDGVPDIPPISAWSDGTAFGSHLTQAEGLSVLLVRGDILMRYPEMVVTAVRSGAPDENGHHRPDPTQPPESPIFVIKIDEATMAYAFAIASDELMKPASLEDFGWFFVFAEHGFRIRFGFDDPPEPRTPFLFDSWDKASWPSDDREHPARAAFVPVDRGFAVAGAAFGPPSGLPAEAPRWSRDSADIARITLQHPFRVAIQADVLLHPNGGA